MSVENRWAAFTDDEFAIVLEAFEAAWDQPSHSEYTAAEEMGRRELGMLRDVVAEADRRGIEVVDWARDPKAVALVERNERREEAHRELLNKPRKGEA